MNIAFLNGSYQPLEEARISPLDRGFLFGDGIYEVVPSYSGKMVGFAPHIQRMNDGLDAIDIQLDWSESDWLKLCNQLIERNGGGNLGLYLHVSRGADRYRFLGYPDNPSPTVFGFAFEIAHPQLAVKELEKKYR